MSRQHFEQQTAESPDITTRVHALAARLFRAHVAGRSRDDTFAARDRAGGWSKAGLVRIGSHRLRQAKVEHLHRPGSGELDIGGLEIEVDDALRVGGLECRRDLARDLQRDIDRERSAGEAIGKCRSLDELHHDGLDTGGDFEAVNRGDVRMVQCGKQSSLSSEACDAIRIVGESRRQHLDGNLAMQSGIERAIDFPHAAGIERAQDAIRSQLGPGGHRGHSAVRDRGILED
jgi:hypothetical protein